MKMTKEEQEIIDKLADAYNLFIELSIIHSRHQEEFMHKIHDAQRIVLCRPALKSIIDNNFQEN